MTLPEIASLLGKKWAQKTGFFGLNALSLRRGPKNEPAPLWKAKNRPRKRGLRLAAAWAKAIERRKCRLPGRPALLLFKTGRLPGTGEKTSSVSRIRK